MSYKSKPIWPKPVVKYIGCHFGKPVTTIFIIIMMVKMLSWITTNYYKNNVYVEEIFFVMDFIKHIF